MSNNQRTYHKTIITLVSCMALAGCNGSVRETLGLNKNAPDEYLVGTNPSLIVPPSFHLPVPGSESAFKKQTTKQEVRETLLRSSASNAVKDANGVELKLLQKADIDTQQTDIRALLKAETETVEAPKKKKKGFFSSLNPFSKDEDVLDAAAEEERLKKEQQENHATTRRPAENPLIAKN